MRSRISIQTEEEKDLASRWAALRGGIAPPVTREPGAAMVIPLVNPLGIGPDKLITDLPDESTMPAGATKLIFVGDGTTSATLGKLYKAAKPAGSASRFDPFVLRAINLSELQWNISLHGTNIYLTLDRNITTMTITNDSNGTEGNCFLTVGGSGGYKVTVPGTDFIADNTNVVSTSDTIDIPDAIGSLCMISFIRLQNARLWSMQTYI